MFGLVSCLLMLLGGCAERLPKAPVTEGDVVQIIEANHGWVNVDPDLPRSPVVAVHLTLLTSDPKAVLPHLDRLKHLKTLSLRGAPVRDEDLECLPSLPGLEHLGLSRTKITDAGLACLQRVPNVQDLVLNQTYITGAGLKYLRYLPNLRVLRLQSTRVTDEAMVHLKGLTKLRYLELGDTFITDAGLKHVQHLRELRSLDLWLQRGITDRGLGHVGKLTQLRSLGLGGTSVTDDGLKYLEKIERLEDVDLRQTKVTPAGIRRLRKALPHCGISTSLPEMEVLWATSASEGQDNDTAGRQGQSYFDGVPSGTINPREGGNRGP